MKDVYRSPSTVYTFSHDSSSAQAVPPTPSLTHPPPEHDSRLIAAAKLRNPEAWRTIYETLYPPLQRYIRSRLDHPEAAQVYAHEALVRAFEGIDGFKDTGKPLHAWIFIIARNFVTDEIRRHKAFIDDPKLAPLREDNLALAPRTPPACSSFTPQDQSPLV